MVESFLIPIFTSTLMSPTSVTIIKSNDLAYSNNGCFTAKLFVETIEYVFNRPLFLKRSKSFVTHA